jgi:hypothetical protein
MTTIHKIAKLVKQLTYDEMMQVADWFTHWTQYPDYLPDDKTNPADLDYPLISRETMASNLSDWADQNLNPENEA